MGGADHFHSLCLHSESGGSAPQLFRHTPHTGCDVDVSALRWDEADSRLYELEKEKNPFESMAAPVFFFPPLLLLLKAKPPYFTAITATIYSCHSLRR